MKIFVQLDGGSLVPVRGVFKGEVEVSRQMLVSVHAACPTSRHNSDDIDASARFAEIIIPSLYAAPLPSRAVKKAMHRGTAGTVVGKKAGATS